MNLRPICCTWLFLLISTVGAFAAEPKLTFYVPFEDGINATIAGGNPQGKFGAGETPKFTNGIAGQGLLSGANNQNVTFDASGNISPDQWTITFWVKGFPGAQWNGGKYFQTFWLLDGAEGDFMWFYHYMDKTNPWLLAQPKKGQGDTTTMMVPIVPEEQWHFWVMSWRKGSGASIYLDGQLVGNSPCHAPTPVKNITIGQAANPYSPTEQDKIIDEFKIYDTALDSGTIARHYWQEGDFALYPTQTVAPTKRKITVDGKIDAVEWENAAGFTGMIDQKSWEIEAPPTWAKVTYDDQNLYLAMHSSYPAKAKDAIAAGAYLKSDAVKHDGNVNDDDSFFLNVMPQASTGKRYNLFVNSKGTIADSLQDLAEADPSWQSSAQVKTIPGVNGWTMEAAIPLKSFGIDHLTYGTTWQINLGRIWKKRRKSTDAWAVGKRIDEKPYVAESGLGTVLFSSTADAVTDLRKFNIAQNGQISTSLNLHNPGTQIHELSVILSAANKVLQQQKVSLPPGSRQTVNLTAIPQDADGGLVEITVKNNEKVLFRQSAPLILERVGQLTMWSYPSLHQLRLGWAIQSVSNPTTLSLDVQLKDTGGKVVQTAAVKQLASINGSTLIDVKSLAPGEYTLETQIKNAQGVLQEQAIAFEKKPLPSWLGNTLGISDTPPSPWTNVEVAKDKDTVSIWGRTYDYAGHLLPTQITNRGQTMLAAPMRLTAQAADGAPQSSPSGKADSRWTKTSAIRADSLRNQILGPVEVKSDSYVEYDGMTWVNMTVSPHKGQARLNGLTLEIPLKAEWAQLIKPSDDYKMQQTGALPEKGWIGKASSMPWVGNGDGGLQFFQETTASWIGSKSIEIVPDGKGATIMRVHLIDVPVTLDKPLNFAFGWITSPVKAAPKNHRDWLILSPGPIETDPAGTNATASYVRRETKVNPAIKPYFLWWQEWWWLPEKFEGNSDETGLLPVPITGNHPKKNAVPEHYGTKFYGAPYGRLTQMGTANPWFEQFGDEWVRSTSKFTPNESVATARQLTGVSQASASMRDFYVWGYDRLLNEGNVHALYFDESHPIFDSNIYHGSGTPQSDGSIEPTRNILGTRRTLQRIYTLLKAKHPDNRIFIHMSGEIVLPVDSFSDALVDGENYYWALNRTDNRGYENVLNIDQFRTEYSSQNNFGPASVFLPQFQNVNSISADEWKTLGYHHADYMLGLIFLHDSKVWWAYMPFEHLSEVHTAFNATGRNADWSFTPYWQQKFFPLPTGIYASIY